MQLQKGRRYREDLSLVMSRPPGALLYVLVLGVTALADIVAFYNVVAVMMPYTTEVFIYILIVGLTVVTLFLAHTAGALLRDQKMGVESGGTAAIAAVTGVWLALGVTAFLVRLIGFNTAGWYSESAVLGQTSAAKEAMLSAAMFAGLYVATGITAAIGSYGQRNLLRTSYVRARQDRTIAADRVSLSAAAYGEVFAIHKAQVSAFKESPDVLEAEKRIVLAFSEQLKQYARIGIAKRCKDPGFTYELFAQDQRQYWYREFDAVATENRSRSTPDGDFSAAPDGGSA